jgi:hypothetical protein
VAGRRPQYQDGERVRRLILFVGTIALIAGIDVVLQSTTAFAGVTYSCDPAVSICGVGVGTPPIPGSGGPTPVSAPGGAGSSSGPCPPGQTATYVTATNGGYPVTAGPGDVNPITGQPVPAGSTQVMLFCNGVYVTTIVVPPGGGPLGPRMTGVQLAQQAFASFHLTTPVPVVSPAEAVVHLPTWLWLTAGWATQSATASVPGLSATVTATPAKVVWTMGDGQLATCFGPGVVYRLDIAPDAQTSDCTATYIDTSASQPNQTYQATVTVFYHATWTATDGTAGDLGTLSASTAFAVRVAEVQSINNG